MIKKLLLFILCFGLTSCANYKNRSNLSATNPNSFYPSLGIESSSIASNLTSSTPTSSIYYQEVESQLDFREIVNNFDSSYSNKNVVALETNYLKYGTDSFQDDQILVHFDSASRQSNTINNVPVINAFDQNHTIKYVELISPSRFDIQIVKFYLSFWSESDLLRVGTNYFVGLEYFLDGNWIRDDSIDLHDLTIGALRNDNDYFEYHLNAKGVRNIRLVFDLPNSSGNARFGIYGITYAGQERFINPSEQIQSIKIKNEVSIVHIGETLKLEVDVSPSYKDEISYSSSSRAIACVLENGTIYALALGKVTITAFNGKINDTITFDVVYENSDVSKIIQEPVYFVGAIPEGFIAQFDELSFFNNNGPLNFKSQGDTIYTPIYDNISGPTIVTLNLKLSSSSDLDLSAQNIFAVAGLSREGQILETISLSNIVNLEFADLEFKFQNPKICQYKIFFEYKYFQIVEETWGTYQKTGKNYCLNYLTIAQQ